MRRAGKDKPDKPEVRGRLAAGRGSFTDRGLVAALYDVLAPQQGLTPEQAKGTVAMMAGIGIASAVSSLPGGEDPRLQEMARGWSAAVQAFLAKPGRLNVVFAPDKPFDLARLQKDGVGAAEILDLDPSVTSGPDRRIALVDPDAINLAPDAPPATTLPAATALIEGRGVPQDIARGMALALPAAGSGNRAAIGLVARALSLDPRVAIQQDQLRNVYEALLLARADHLPADDRSLDAVRSRLSPEELAAAEDEALERWRATPTGAAQKQAEMAAFRTRDWAAIRRLAFAYYEGASMPRNAMRAYGWASIAAAGGDRIAASLRDDLTVAASDGRFVVPLDRTRKAVADLWRLLIADSVEAPHAGDEPKVGAPTAKAAPEPASEPLPAPARKSPDDAGAAAPAPDVQASAPPAAGDTETAKP